MAAPDGVAAFVASLDEMVELSEMMRVESLVLFSDPRFAQNGAGGTRFIDASAGEAEADTPVLAMLRPGRLYVSLQLS